MSRKEQKQKKEFFIKIDSSIKNLLKNVKLILNDEELINEFPLINDVLFLKQLIPIVVNNDKETYLKLYLDCTEFTIDFFKNREFYLEFIVTKSTLKFISEIDKNTKGIELKKN